eukprot:gnl/MRDRNA2_/MRDRNA2_95855_c0_seq1.p1 gnl/MRDRNA2_/MRDRNA2_95855_c0~~gnl/MRDRNA2_/MRDRNA2_95855_c0_seq1.p1  ORF type:complete len:587 (+),score=146.80 gnl/MRDRNA2_/MRDRNA2_95855_c0_seq1:151-1911(+)
MTMADYNISEPEYKRAYFDRSLRSCLVELVTACLQHRPGVEKADEILPEKYAAEVLDPFFQRLAKDCIESQPSDPLSFMQAWTTNQPDVVASKPLVDFVSTWCGSRADEWKAKDRKLAELESQYTSLTEQLETTALGFVLLQRPGNADAGLVHRGIVAAPALAINESAVATTQPVDTTQYTDKIKALQQKLDESAGREDALRKDIEQMKEAKTKPVDVAGETGILQQKLDESAGREDALRQEIEQLKAENSKLKEENVALLKREAAALEQAESARAASNEAMKNNAGEKELATTDDTKGDKRQSVLTKEGSACVGIVLRKLMSQGVTSASAAFSFFEPAADATVTREKLTEKTIELDCLETAEIATLCEYLDPQEAGVIVFEDFKAALQRFLASSGDVHSSLSEDEFNTVMHRIKEKFENQGISVAQVFREYDLDNSGTLQRHEFIEGLSKLRLGLSTKEIAQLFYAMDASGDGILSLNEFEDAITSGLANPLLDWAQSTFQKIAEALLQGAASEACAKHALKPELQAMTHDGFVKMIREHDASLSLTDIGRLWCVVDKLGDSSGNADVAELSKHFTLNQMRFNMK